MQLVQRFLLVGVLFEFFYFSNAHVEYDGWINIELQHSLHTKDFAYRSNISVLSLSTGLSYVAQSELTANDMDKLEALAISDDFYRLKAVVTFQTGLKKTFFTANKACNLLNNNLNEEIWVSVDANGYVNAITLSTPQGSNSGCLPMAYTYLGINEFKTEVLIKHTELAPIPDTSSFIQKLEREREAKERGESKDNRGFFVKYWMYILPLVLLVFISGATNNEPQK